jgi:hypothetical protein
MRQWRAEKVIAHAAENGGRCRLGFVKELVGKVSQRAPLLEITPDNINNRVRIIKGQPKEEEQRDVSTAIPFHIIRDPSLSTDLDTSVSASSNEQNPLDILASTAVQTFENTNQAQDFRGMQLTLPNRCSYQKCGAPLSEAIQKERDSILQIQGITPNTSSTRNVIYSQKSLLKSGSGRLAGGADAAQRISETASSLNVPGFTASTLMSLMHKNEKKNKH